jgi:hypothetical protein
MNGQQFSEDVREFQYGAAKPRLVRRFEYSCADAYLSLRAPGLFWENTKLMLLGIKTVFAARGL